MNHEKYMEIAIGYAKKAYENDEVPIGAIVVKEDTVLGVGWNVRETKNKPSGHAEIEALDQAGEALGSWNLSGCTLYVTIEPCLMCTGAIVQSRISTVVYGARELKHGALGSVINVIDHDGFNHYPSVVSGVLENQCRSLMLDFFKNKRKETIKIKRVDETTAQEYRDVRKRVFIDEQSVDPKEEYDVYDEPFSLDVIHVGAFYKNNCVGSMRLIKEDTRLIVGRVAVLKEHRNQKIGSKLLNYAEVHAKNNGFDSLILGAQCQAIPFYTAHGYQTYGAVFLDAGIEHKMMRKAVKKDAGV